MHFSPELRIGLAIAAQFGRSDSTLNLFCKLPRSSSISILLTFNNRALTRMASTRDENLTSIVGRAVAEETIKKSRFIGYCCPATSLSDGMSLLEDLQAEHNKARHICWAWQGIGPESRYQDDGEPSGTAGQPILSAIQGEGLSETFVAVVRYFGGILLGTGGLVRAYGGTARQCLRAAEKVVRVPRSLLKIEAPMGLIGAVYHATSRCTRINEEFTDINVVLTVEIESKLAEIIKVDVIDATRGAATVTFE